MSQDLLIGTYGWEHEAWQGVVYTDDMPPDWRFCYYSNDFRGVLVPADAWAGTDAKVVSGWLEDCDPEFRFVLELPGELLDAASADEASARLATFCRLVEPLRDQTAAVLARIPASQTANPDLVEPVLRDIDNEYPLCVDSDQEGGRLGEFCQQAGIARCWYPERVSTPAPEGRFLVTLVDRVPLRRLREIMERLDQWVDTDRQAGLFFVTPASAYQQAEAARTLAELMGV